MTDNLYEVFTPPAPAAGTIYREAPCPMQIAPSPGEALIAMNRTEERDTDGRVIVDVEWRGAESAEVGITLHLVRSLFDLARFPEEIRCFPWALELVGVEGDVGRYRRV